MPERERRLLGPIGKVARSELTAPLEHAHPQPLLGHPTRGNSTTEAGAHDHHVVCALHNPVLSQMPSARTLSPCSSGAQNCRTCAGSVKDSCHTLSQRRDSTSSQSRSCGCGCSGVGCSGRFGVRAARERRSRCGRRSFVSWRKCGSGISKRLRSLTDDLSERLKHAV